MRKCLNHSSRKLSPELTEINFAVPSRTLTLDQNNNLIPNVIPGEISETSDAVKSISTLTKAVNMMCGWQKKLQQDWMKNLTQSLVFLRSGSNNFPYPWT